jgi:hypothetical protein
MPDPMLTELGWERWKGENQARQGAVVRTGPLTPLSSMGSISPS